MEIYFLGTGTESHQVTIHTLLLQLHVFKNVEWNKWRPGFIVDRFQYVLHVFHCFVWQYNDVGIIVCEAPGGTHIWMSDSVNWQIFYDTDIELLIWFNSIIYFSVENEYNDIALCH